MKRILTICAMAILPVTGVLADTVLEVTVTNNAPGGGVYLTPVWFGFHNGSFDSYDGGTASAFELERLAEDGNASFLADTFASGGTLAGNGSQLGSERVQGLLGGGPLAPGAAASQFVTVSDDGSNQYFSYASMVLPSNDYYIANGNPFAFDLSDIIENGGEFSFDVFQVNDAGTEVNDFSTSAGNGLFPQLKLTSGQGGPDEGADENGVNRNVLSPFAGFLNAPFDADTDPNFALLNFNDRANYPNGLATVTIRSVNVVPEPTTFVLLATGVSAVLIRRRR